MSIVISNSVIINGEEMGGGGGSSFAPVHIEIVKIFKGLSANGPGRVITPDDRFVRYQGPLGDLDPGYFWPEDFAADKSPIIRPQEMPETMGDYAYTSALGPFPAGIYYIEHTGILDADITLHDASVFDGCKRFLVRVPAGATTEADFYAQYNDLWSAEISATRTGGDNGGPPGGEGAASLMDFSGYRMKMSGMVNLEEGDSIMIIADFSGVSEANAIYWNRLVARKIGEAIPKIQRGTLEWAP